MGYRQYQSVYSSNALTAQMVWLSLATVRFNQVVSVLRTNLLQRSASLKSARAEHFGNRVGRRWVPGDFRKPYPPSGPASRESRPTLTGTAEPRPRNVLRRLFRDTSGRARR